MFSGFLNKITNTLEAIDNHAATTAGVSQDQTENRENNFFSENENEQNVDESDSRDAENPPHAEDISFIKEEKNFALSELHATQDKLQDLLRKNMKLEDKNQELYEKIRNSETTIAKLEAKLKQVQNELMTNKKKQTQFEENYGQNRTNFDKMRDTLEGDLTDTKAQLTSIKHEHQITEERLQKLEQDMKNKEAEIAQLEEENSQLRNKILNDISQARSGENTSVSQAQCEMLESEVQRLKEKNAKMQQKVNQSEAIIKEIEIQKQREIGDFKQAQASLETDLFKAKMRLEELTHEMSLVKSQANAEKEEYESTLKEKMEQEREEFRLEINRMKERNAQQIAQLKKSDSSSLQDQLNIALANIENLKSEKAALLLNLESAAMKSNMQQSVSVDVKKKKSPRFVTLASMVKSKKSILHKVCIFIDKIYMKISKAIDTKPLLRVVVFLVFIVLFINKLVSLF